MNDAFRILHGKYNAMIDLQKNDYDGETFRSLNLANADLSGKSFTDCVFEKCDLSLIQLVNTSLRNVRFVGCKIIGVNFTKCSRTFLEFSFDECLIDTCGFTGLRLTKRTFTNSVIRECSFIESDLRGADFSGSDLERTTFQYANLEAAYFARARNYAIDPLTTKIKGATFSLPEAIALLSSLGISLEQ